MEEIERLAASFYAIFDNRGGRAADPIAAAGLFAQGASVSRMSDALAETWSVDQFLRPRLAMLTDGTLTEFSEWEVAGTTDILGRIASRTSRYEKAGLLGGASYRGHGSKLIHLVRTGLGWRVQHVLWEDATSGPRDLLHTSC